MPGEDWWDGEVFSIVTEAQVEEQQALKWLVSQMRGHNLWMDGTSHWSLPLSVLSGFRTRTAMEAILTAYRKYKSYMELRHGGDHATRPETVPGAVSPGGDLRPGISHGAADDGLPGE